MSRHSNGILKKIYAIIGIVLLVWSSYLVYILVMHIWHQHGEEVENMAISEEEKLFKEMMKDKKEVTYNLGYKVIKQEDIEKHFHHIGDPVMHDSINICIKCHGDIPHDKNKAIRAFLNMHSDFFACETCHVRVDNKKFIWYNKTTGKEVDNFEISVFLNNIPQKLIPLLEVDGKFERLDSDSKRNFVDEFRKMLPTLSPDKKSQGLKIIHKNVSKNPVKCDECHAPSLSQSYLPLLEIGYKERRVNQILSNEVVGMVEKYKEFYIPNFLMPGQTK
ncbi:MAG: hypothetical protein PWQ25_1749 [Deferribacteres bacterium]|nr:hypothetical protein [Deferribacteres bacterium]